MKIVQTSLPIDESALHKNSQTSPFIDRMRSLSLHLREFGFDEPEEILSSLAADLVNAAYKRRWNLQSPAFMSEFINNNSYDPESAVLSLARGITSEHAFDYRGRLVLNEIPPSLHGYYGELPRGFFDCQLADDPRRANHSVCVYWYYIPALGRILPLESLEPFEFTSKILKAALDENGTLRYVSSSIEQSKFEKRSQEFGPLTVYSLVPEGGRIRIGAGKNGKLEAPPDNIIEAALSPNYIPLRFRLCDGTQVVPLEVAECRDKSGNVLKVLASGEHLKPPRRRDIGEAHGSYWIRGLKVGERSGRGYLEGMPVPDGHIGKDAELLNDAEGNPIFVKVGERGFPLKRVELRTPDNKTEVVFARTGCIAPGLVRRAQEKVRDKDGHLVITGLKLYRVKHASHVQVAGWLLKIGDAFLHSFADTHAVVHLYEDGLDPGVLLADLGHFGARSANPLKRGPFQKHSGILLERSSAGYYSAIARETRLSSCEISLFHDTIVLPASLIKQYCLRERAIFARPLDPWAKETLIDSIIVLADKVHPRLDIKIVREKSLPVRYRVSNGDEHLSGADEITIRRGKKLLCVCKHVTPPFEELMEFAAKGEISVEHRCASNALLSIGRRVLPLPWQYRNEKVTILLTDKKEPIKEVVVHAITFEADGKMVEIVPEERLFPIWQDGRVVGYRHLDNKKDLFLVAHGERGELFVYRSPAMALSALRRKKFTGTLCHIPVPRSGRFGFEANMKRTLPETDATHMHIEIIEGVPDKVHLFSGDDGKPIPHGTFSIDELPAKASTYSDTRFSPSRYSLLATQYLQRVRQYESRFKGKSPDETYLLRWFSSEELAAIREEIRAHRVSSYDAKKDGYDETLMDRKIAGNVKFQSADLCEFVDILEETNEVEPVKLRIVQAVEKLAVGRALSNTEVIRRLIAALQSEQIDLRSVLQKGAEL